MASILPPIDALRSRLGPIIHNSNGRSTIIVLHGADVVCELTPEQARREALELLDLANLATRPGQL